MFGNRSGYPKKVEPPRSTVGNQSTVGNRSTAGNLIPQLGNTYREEHDYCFLPAVEVVRPRALHFSTWSFRLFDGGENVNTPLPKTLYTI